MGKKTPHPPENESDGPKRERVIDFACVCCGERFDPTKYWVPCADQLPDLTILLVRCESCTRERRPLPARVKS